MRLALLICLMLSPMAAHAEPVTLAIAAIAAWGGVSVATVYLVAATVVLTVGTAVYGSAQQRKAERLAKDQARAGLQDRMVTRIATESPHRYIYGRARVGSDVVAMFTSGANDELRHIVCVHAAHECDAIEEIYINNIALGALDGAGNVTGGKYLIGAGPEMVQEQRTGASFTLTRTPIAGTVRAIAGNYDIPDYEVGIISVVGNVVTLAAAGSVTVLYQSEPPGIPKVNVQKHLGQPGAVADAYLRSLIPGQWPATATLDGLCYTVITLSLDVPEFQSGMVPMQALIRGRKLYDPRDGITRWSQNVALAVRDYLTSPLCGVAAADIPVSQIIAAANVCDETSVAGGLYTINGTVTSDQAQSSVLEAMAQAMAGGIVSTTWDVYAGKYIAPVAALVQSDIVGALSITPGVSDAAIYNGVKGQYIDPANGYVATDYRPFQNAAYRAADGRDLYTNIDFQFTDSLQRAHNLARIFVEDQRNGFTIKAEFSLKAWPLKVGQRVTFTSAFIGQSAKVYRITDKTYSPSSAVELTLKEDAAEIWDFADAVLVDATPNTNLPDPWAIAALASISCSSGTAELLMLLDGSIVSRIYASWPQSTTHAVVSNGLIEIEWQRAGSDVWEKITASGDSAGTYISPVKDGAFYVVRARCVNPYMQTKSDWTYSAPHKVIGKTAPPANVAIFLYSRQPDGTRQFSWGWESEKPLDLAGYRIRYKQAASAVWADMTSLHTDSGFLVSSPYETNQLLAGLYTFGIKTVDTTGNESLDAVYITAQLDNPRLGKILVAESAFSAGWPGVKTSASVIDGLLEASDTATWATVPASWDAWTRWNFAPLSPIVYDHPMIDIGAVVLFKPIIQADADGTTTVTESHSDNNIAWTSYAPLAGAITARYVKVRASIAGAYPLARDLVIWLEANTKTEDVNDLNTALAPVRIGVGDFRIPLRNTYSVIAQVNLALQNVGAGWSWEVIDKSPTGPRIKIYNASNVLADATIDAYIKGY